MTIRAAADGSALGNPGPAGWAWYVSDDCWAAGGWPRATNNQGELNAVLQLFRASRGINEDLHVMCDSQYVIKAITQWMPGWKRRGWRKADGSPVLNQELLRALDAELQGRSYRFEWVKGHANHAMNEAADERARGAATAYQRKSAVPEGPGWTLGGSTADAVGQPPAADYGGGGQVPPVDIGGGRLHAMDAPPSLFDEPAQTERAQTERAQTGSAGAARQLSVELHPEQFAALTERARARGLSPETLLREIVTESLGA
ncbi:ribonuclease HI [Saxibacter everestensis]|uniref:Ribonuclease H n=1 Tax=Saxibacter everestensis TaxID=2909229 RepID=A0ABY8QXH2_9MICO|nr:ribonuclease HI [Brevibacteriaceae bacterium ZFBP1038]